MLISVIVPVYRAEKYIRRCIDSLIAQSYKELEFVLVDDGSPDNCPRILDEYAEQDSRIKVVHCQNGGSMRARQVGFDAASGDYIGFADSDDWLEPSMYEELAAAVEKHNADIGICGYYIELPEGTKEHYGNLKCDKYDKKALEEEIYPRLLKTDSHDAFLIEACCWNKIYRKDILKDNIRRVDGRAKVGEDSAFVFSSIIDSEKIAVVHKCLYHYFCREDSIMTGYNPKMTEIIYLPAEALSEKNKECKYDFTEQLYYYTIRLANVFTLNEVRGNTGFFVKRKNINEFINNSMMREAVTNIDFNTLPKKTKMLAKLIKLKSVLGIQIYILIKGLYIRKIRNREKRWS